MLMTTNYGLKKIELKDSPPDITVINPNWDLIDVEMENHAVSLAEIVNGFANLKGNNGYTKLPNGFILQWGSINLTLNKGSWSTNYLNLPIAFPNIGVTGGACATYNDTTGTLYQALGVNAMVQANYSKTQVGVGLCDTGATGSPLATGVNTIGVRWWVLGY